MKVKPGIEVFLEKQLDLVKGKKVGLATNPTGVDRGLRSNVELFYTNREIDLIALYGPEHGVRGNVPAGRYVPFSREKKYGLPVFSLYGQSQKLDPEAFNNMDAFMRSYDIREDGKIPESSMLKELDVLIFDIQDIGTRIYTYIATMAFCMQACAENGIKFIVLDRPNPINGCSMEGPVLDYPRFSSFVGLYPIPVRHGMTIGELAGFFNADYLQSKADLVVIPMENWSRKMWFEDTGLPWISPSPNIPTLNTAVVYPGQVFLEGTNLSEGRGTTLPFEYFGAPWINGNELSEELNRRQLPGVTFREAWFTPLFSKYQKKLCGGAQIHVRDRNAYLPFATVLTVLSTIIELYPTKLEFYSEYFDKIMGTDQVRRAILKEEPVKAVLDFCAQGIRDFIEARKAHLLY